MVEEGNDTCEGREQRSMEDHTKPIVSAPRFTSSTKGIGDSVLIYQGGRGVANIVYSGGSNFVVKFYSGSNSDLLVNEIGHYKDKWSSNPDLP
jgi:hypothetical protein